MNYRTTSRFFFGVYFAANAGLVLYGLLGVIQPAILLDSFSLHVYQFPAAALTAVAYLTALFRLLCYFNLLLGGLGLVLLWRFYQGRRSWILYTVMASSLLSYLGPIVFDNTVGHIGFFEILEHVLFAAMLIAGPALLLQKRIASYNFTKNRI